MRELELVLPAYNEAASLERIVARSARAAQDAGFNSETFQLVLVQNGSTDNSEQVLTDLKKSELAPWFRVVTVPVNKGYGYGIWSGLKETKADGVAWSHADQQCDPKDVFRAWDILKQSGDRKLLIKGVRSGRSKRDIFVSRVFEIFAKVILGMSVYEINAQPKVFYRDLLAFVTEPPFTFAFDLYVLYQAQKNGFKIKTIPVLFASRLHGASKWAANFLSRYSTILGMIAYMGTLSRKEGRL